MRQELDNKLCSDHPVIFSDRHADMQVTAMCWGFDCEDGWYTLIDHLCRSITFHLKYNAVKGTPNFVASQVKEKFGRLRFYGHGGDQSIQNFIQFAESLSGRICYECGAMEGTTQISDNGWISTLCPTHADKIGTRQSQEHESTIQHNSKHDKCSAGDSGV